MKFEQLIVISASLSLSLISMTTAVPYEAIIKRENTPVYIEFREIAKTFTEFYSGVIAASPDFNNLAYDLNVISTTANSALSLLKQSGKTQLDSKSVEDIKQSLATSAQKATSAEEMATKGNAWYHEKQVVGKIAQILELDAFQFYALTSELKQRVTPSDFSNLAKSLSDIVCHFVTAIETIEPNTLSKGTHSPVTYCVNYQAGLRGSFDTDGFDIAFVAPPGIDTCGNSASRFLDAAYSEGTLGSTVTKCTEKNVGLIGPSLPKDALGLKK